MTDDDDDNDVNDDDDDRAEITSHEINDRHSFIKTKI